MVTVQVLMSTYNGEKYIKDQVDSLMRQKDVKVNLLVRDDGSKDHTVDILKDYQARGLLKLVTGPNLGYAKSFLTLIDQSEEADFYAFCDQDDVWMEDKLISAVQKLQLNSQDKPLLYCSALQRVDEQLNLLEVQSFVKLKLGLCSQLVRERLAGCTFVMNRCLKKLLQGSSELNLSYSHDSWTVLLCWACGGRVIFDSTPHILFRRYGTNTSVDGGGIVKRIKHELRYLGKCRDQRYNTVRLLVDTYGNDIDPLSIDFLEKIYNYKGSIMKTIRFAFDKQLDCGIKISNLITRFVILARSF